MSLKYEPSSEPLPNSPRAHLNLTDGARSGTQGQGFKGALANGGKTGRTWGTLSAAFCGVEVPCPSYRT